MLCPSYCPAPFFVLDEVDAALDNSNIGKVRLQLRHFEISIVHVWAVNQYPHLEVFMGYCWLMDKVLVE